MSCRLRKTEEEPEVKVFTEPETEIRPPDGGWGWVVCFAAFMSNFTVTGITSANGILLLGLLDVFHESVSKTSLVGSIISGVSMCGGPLVLLLMICGASHRKVMIFGAITASISAACSAFAPNIEVLIFTYSVLAGLSVAVNYFAANIILGGYFDKKRALALGIANSGSGCGSFVLSYLCEKSISFYGLRGTFLLIAGLFLNLIVYAALCRPLKPVIKSTKYISVSSLAPEDEVEGTPILEFISGDENTEDQAAICVISNGYSVERSEPIPEKIQMRRMSVYSEQLRRSSIDRQSRCCFDVSIFQNNTFCLLLVIYLSWAVGDSLCIYLPAYAESIGSTRERGAMVMSIYGIISTFSQIFVGFLADVMHIPISYLLFSSLFGMFLSMILFPFCTTFAALASTTVLFSMAYSFGIALRIVIIAAFLGIDKVSEALTVMALLIGLGYVAYPIVSGLLYDTTHSFYMIFYMDSGITLLGAILCCGIFYVQKKEKAIR